MNAVSLNLSMAEAQTWIYYQDAPARAARYRLDFAQRQAKNHQALEREWPNLWQAVQQSYEQRAWDQVVAFREALLPFLDLRGHWAQGLALNDWACEAAQVLGDDLNAARWAHDRADILHQSGKYAEAEQAYATSEQAYRALGAEALALTSRHMRSLVVRAQGRLAEAEQLCRATLADARQLGLDRWLAHPLYVEGLLARDRGDFRRAQACIAESLARLDGSDEWTMIAQCHHFLGELALLQDRRAQARTELELSLRLSRQSGILRRVAATQRLLGDLAKREGRWAEADRTYADALDLVTRLGDQPQLARLLLSRAHLMALQERTPLAGSLLQGALAVYQEIGDARGEAGVSALLARHHFYHGAWREAVRAAREALRTAWAAGLLRPGVLVGLLKRRGQWA